MHYEYDIAKLAGDKEFIFLIDQRLKMIKEYKGNEDDWERREAYCEELRKSRTVYEFKLEDELKTQLEVSLVNLLVRRYEAEKCRFESGGIEKDRFASSGYIVKGKIDETVVEYKLIDGQFDVLPEEGKYEANFFLRIENNCANNDVGIIKLEIWSKRGELGKRMLGHSDFDNKDKVREFKEGFKIEFDYRGEIDLEFVVRFLLINLVVSVDRIEVRKISSLQLGC